MKKLLSIMLAVMFVVGMWPNNYAETVELDEPAVHYTDPTDPDYLVSVEDAVYLSLLESLDSNEYVIEDVQAIYISQEYLDELAFNSRVNIYFGYTLDEVEAMFQGKQYVFTLGENNQTVVEEFQEYHDDRLETIIKNVAIGTGVILVCVTVTVVSAGAGAPAVCAIFAYAADGAIIAAGAGAKFGAITGGVVKLFETGDINDALDAAVMSASEGYKWGAITGAAVGGVSETVWLGRATKAGLTMNEAAVIQFESNYPLELIRQFHDFDEYTAFKNAGLEARMVNDKIALVRYDIDLNQVDEFGHTNLERMLNGNAPLDSTGTPFELHHIGQRNGGSLAIVTSKEHDTIPVFKQVSEINRNKFNKEKKRFWKEMAKILSEV